MTDGLGLNRIFRLRMSYQIMKENLRLTIILTLLFMGMVAMYAGMYPQFQNSLIDMMESGALEDFGFFAHADQMHTYIGFLTVELYAIFWQLLLAIILGFVAAASISKEIEGKTIDLLMSNPVSRKQIVFEKFIGLIPMFLVINFITMFAVLGITNAINESIDFGNLFLVHLVSIPYFLAVLSIGILLSVIINEKMKASIFLIALLIGMFFINSISLMTPDIEFLGNFSLSHHFDPFVVLNAGEVNISGVLVYISIITVCLITSMIYFEHKDITV